MKSTYLLALPLMLLLSFGISLNAQDDDLLKGLENEDNSPVLATFKGTRLINCHTVEVPGRRTLDFRIAHRFGSFNSGWYDFFGLDGGASIRIGLEYSYDGTAACRWVLAVHLWKKWATASSNTASCASAPEAGSR